MPTAPPIICTATTYVRECGTSGRTFKSSLLFAVPDSATAITTAARDLLAWEDINDDADTVKQLEDAQKRALSQSVSRAKADLREAIWRSYRHVFLLSKSNAVKDMDLGQIKLAHYFFIWRELSRSATSCSPGCNPELRDNPDAHRNHGRHAGGNRHHLEGASRRL